MCRKSSSCSSRRHSSSAVKSYIEDARESSVVVRNQIAEQLSLQDRIAGLATKVSSLEVLMAKLSEEQRAQKAMAHFDEDSVKALLLPT